MSQNITKEELQEEITKRNIYLDENIKWTNERLIKILGDYTLSKTTEDTHDWATNYVQSLETVMLCRHLKDEPVKFKDTVKPFTNECYIAERKLNGFRHVLAYSPTRGFQAFSRDESVETFLNGNFTNKILFVKDGIVRRPEDFKNKLDVKFILDGEITVDSENAVFDGIEYESIEDYIQAILGSGNERAQKFQLDGHRLIFNIFDVLYLETDVSKHPEVIPTYNYTEYELNAEQTKWVEETYEDYLESAGFKGANARTLKKLYSFLYKLKDTSQYDLRSKPFYKRRKIRHKLVANLNKMGIPAVEVMTENTNKLDFLDEMLSSGEEGIILKNLNAPYISGLKSSRSHRACLKVKQNMSTMLESNANDLKDFDVFITGANPPKSHRIKDMIGALRCSVYVHYADETRIHEIACVSGIPHEWKRKFAHIDEETGAITLNPEYLNKVIAIDGLALTAGNLKFQHAVIKGNMEFKAKNPIDCTWDIEELEKMTLVRGR